MNLLLMSISSRRLVIAAPLLLTLAPPTFGQSSTGQIVTAQASSTLEYGESDGARTIAITNVTYATTGAYVPGRPGNERLALRTTVRTREVIDEKGLDATVTVEAWPLGTHLAEKPLYALTYDGVGAWAEDNSVLVFDRQTEDLAWWSVHALGTGKHLFDTHVPRLRFSITPDIQTLRFVGLDVPPGDAPDARLRDTHVVGLLSYASAEGVIRRTLLTCSDPARGELLRSYWDERRDLSLLKGDALTLEITWTTLPPSEPDRMSALIPITGDDLDLGHAQLPPCLAVAPWTD